MEGIPVQKSFRVMMEFLCRLLPRGKRRSSESVDSTDPPPLINRRSHWYSAVVSHWMVLSAETPRSATQLLETLQTRLVAVGLDVPPATCSINWSAPKLDWVAAAHHTLKFAEQVQRMAEVLLRVNVETTEAAWDRNAAGRVEPVDVLLQFTPTWINSDEVPEAGDRVMVCDGIERKSWIVTLEHEHLPSRRPLAWLDWGGAVLKRILVSSVLTSSSASSCPPP